MSHIPGAECPDCLRRLVESTLAACRADEDTMAEMAREAEWAIVRGLMMGRPPAIVANHFLAMMQEHGDLGDFMADKKAEDMAAAQHAVARLGAVEDRLHDRVRAAIIGNSLDHFLVTNPDEFWGGGLDFELAVDHLARAEKLMTPGASLVILADNAGEQCFDRLLVEHLLGRGCQVSYVVKSGPVQNDLTLADLEAHGEKHGLGRVVGSGTSQVGLDPDEIPADLRRLLDQADLVIAKGMGHYETLRGLAGLPEGLDSPWPILFLLLAKCPPIAQSLGVEVGQGLAVFAAGI